MADDTRQVESDPSEENSQQEARRPRRPKPKHDFPKTQAGKMWEAFGNPQEPANTMPGGMVNSAGGRPPDVTWRDAFKFSLFSKDDLKRFYQMPCARDSLLIGIGAGGAVGGLRFVLVGMKPCSSSKTERDPDAYRHPFDAIDRELRSGRFRNCVIWDVLLVRAAATRRGSWHCIGCSGHEDAQGEESP